VLIWTFACERGGVGKTSLSLAVAEAAARRGKRTLVVDLDPQGNSSRRLLGWREDALDAWSYEGPSVADVLTAEHRGAAIEHIVATHSAWPDELYLLASPGPRLTLIDRTTAAAADRRLSRGLHGLDRHDFDLVIVDSAPSLGLLTQNGLTAADAVFVVARPSGSRQGVAETVSTANLLAEEYGGEVAGLVLTAVEPSSARSRATAAAMERWEEEWEGRILSQVARSSIWQTAEAAGRPLASYLGDFGRNRAAAAALAAAEQILDARREVTV